MNESRPPTTNAAKLRQCAEERLRARPAAVPLTAEDAQRQLHELQVHQIELELQNEELVHARAELEAGAEKYADLYDFAPVSYLTLDPDGTIDEANLTAATFLGTDRNQLIGRRFGLFIAEECRAECASFLQTTAASHVKCSCELTLGESTTPQRTVHIEGIGINSRSGVGRQCHVMVIDITEHTRESASIRSLLDDVKRSRQILATALEDQEQVSEALRDSEARLRTIINTSPECVKLLAADGTVLEMNPAGLRMIEADSFEQVASCSVYPLLLEEHRQGLRELTDKVFSGGTGFLQFEITGLKGRRRWLESHATPMRDGAGNIIAALAITRDITDRKRTEEKLQENEARFRQLSENIREVFWITDVVRQQLIFISPAYETIWGRSCESLYHTPANWLEAIHPEDRERVKNASMANHVSGGYDEEYRIIRPDDSVRWIHDKAFPVKNAAGEVFRIVGVAEDITERRNNQLLALRSQRLESLGTLASGVAHDLNNALAPIMMSAGLLKIQYPKESQILDTIAASAKRGADMVRQLLSFAKGVEGVRVPLQLSRLVLGMEKMMQCSFPKAIRVEVKCEPDLPTVQGDSTQLDQVLLNLCVNARDAMPDGGTLTLEAKRVCVDDAHAKLSPDAKAGDYVMLRVRDTGTGIPVEIIDRIFDPFFTTKDMDKGTGLGLATVLGIMKGHGGFLQVDSQPGEGSTFSVYLPAEAGSIDTEDVVLPPMERYDGQGGMILFVDDELSLRNMARMVLRRLNFVPVIASDGADALIHAVMHRSELRAIITDLNMPHMDGIHLVRELRRLLPETPVIVSSGRMEESLRADFLSLNVTVFLDKPFTERQLIEALNKLFALECSPN